VDQINAVIHNACRGTLEGFGRVSSPSQYGITPLRVAYLQQTKIEEPKLTAQLSGAFSALLVESDSRDGHDSSWSLDISYWWLMFAEHQGDLELCESLANDIIRRVDLCERLCLGHRCWFGQRGFYAAYETLANLCKSSGRLEEAERYLRKAIVHRIAYDRIWGGLYAIGAVQWER
jgi:hypothetical protein